MAALPTLRSTTPAAVELGGLRGYRFDHTLADGVEPTCQGGGPAAIVPLVYRPATETAEVLWWGQSERWTTRYYLLDVPGGGVLLIAIEVESDLAEFDALVEVLEPVLASFSFGS
jgi:hypothetical protein